MLVIFISSTDARFGLDFVWLDSYNRNNWFKGMLAFWKLTKYRTLLTCSQVQLLNVWSQIIKVDIECWISEWWILKRNGIERAGFKVPTK